MEIREFLELTSSRLNADLLADRMLDDPELLDVVLEIVKEDADPVSMRAAWSLNILCKQHPLLLEERATELIGILLRANSPGVVRCFLSMLMLVRIPEERAGILFDYCFTIIESAKSEIAQKANAMSILYNISNMEPELKPELLVLLESQLDDDSAGVMSRARLLLKKLYRELGRKPGATY